MTSNPSRLRPWLMGALLLAMTLGACTPAASSEPPTQAPDEGSAALDRPVPGGGGSDPDSGPDDPVVAPSVDPGAQPPRGDAALPVEPEPGIVDPRPHAWDHISIAPDGRTLTVYYWGGVQDCYGLADVDVQLDAQGRLEITVLEGRRGNLEPGTACIEIALLKSVTITLDEPLVAPVG